MCLFSDFVGGEVKSCIKGWAGQANLLGFNTACSN